MLAIPTLRAGMKRHLDRRRFGVPPQLIESSVNSFIPRDQRLALLQRGADQVSLLFRHGSARVERPAAKVETNMIGIETAVQKRYQDRAFMDQLRDTRKTSEVDPSDYDAIYLTGGHGVMFDFTDEGLAKKVAEFFEAGKIVSAVCHGPGGLLNVRLSTGEYLLKGRKVTGFSWREEELAKRAEAVPFNLEEEMKKRGAEYEKAMLPYTAHVVEDGRLVTGQNPKSARGVGEAVVKQLRKP